MFLLNYYKFLAGYLAKESLGTNSPDFTDYTGASVTGSSVGTYSPHMGYWRVNDSGTYAELARYGSAYMISNGSNCFYGSVTADGAWVNCGAILGDGNTPPSVTDYCLSGNMITDFTAATAISILTTENGVEITATYTITNTGASDITIREIGLTKGGAYSDTHRILYYREVLATPVTIAPGSSGVVTLKIKAA